MIVEGKKLTAFDAMEEAISLSEMYRVYKTNKSVDFRYSHSMEAVIFEFGFWEKYDFHRTDHYTVYLDGTTTAGNSFSELFKKLGDEKAKIEKEKEQCNSEL